MVSAPQPYESELVVHIGTSISSSIIIIIIPNLPKRDRICSTIRFIPRFYATISSSKLGSGEQFQAK
jgi:hypothetical protein